MLTRYQSLSPAGCRSPVAVCPTARRAAVAGLSPGSLACAPEVAFGAELWVELLVAFCADAAPKPNAVNAAMLAAPKIHFPRIQTLSHRQPRKLFEHSPGDPSPWL